MTDLNQKVAAAARWSMINTVVRRVGTFATGVVLARLFFGPYEWGLYAIGLLVLAMLLSLNEMGVSLALVRWDGDIKRFAPTVLTLSTLSSSAFYLLLFVTAPTVARLLGSPEATTMLRLLCLTVIIDGIACVPIGKLNREFQQFQRTVVDVANFLVNTAVTIGLAATGMGVMAFAWGSLAGNIVALVGFGLCAPEMLRFGWDRAQAVHLLRFGLPLASASLLTLGIVNVDSVVVSGVLGPAALGLYAMAFNMSSWPVRIVSDTARRVSYAGFSRLADSPQAFAAGFHRALAVVLAAAVPFCVLLAVLADPIIRLVYGDQWAGAALSLQFLVALGLIRVVVDLAYDCLATRVRKSLMVMQAWWLFSLTPVLLLFAHRFGIAGVAAGQVVVAGLLVAPVFVVVLSRLGIRPALMLRACVRPVLGGVMMGALAWGMHLVLGGGFLPLAVIGLAALAVYLPFVLPLLRSSWAGRSQPGREAARDGEKSLAAVAQS
ncbi:oligosaccharide flippase family protein [Micromonospora inositola]|uniref:Polysaccharide transporter, PST family n=1 Tax=Micromonospora inositola TaxID=47865 RepID=A0A1C5JDK6_9ACTN|nr:oligosaccharide flippase family protein [Micromonospora inositola]SCG68664.1 polysaccharide transporter, PST family [Micromonospora inositola]